VPEITDGIVEVKGIAREPGERTKIAVWSKDDKVDAVGACVGMRGTRVKEIVRELQGERVDIVRWADDLKEYVKNSVSPAEISEMKIDKTNKKIEIIVADDQLSIGIGKHGQNIRLASKLVGWEMDIRSKEPKPEAKAAQTEEAQSSKLPGPQVAKAGAGKAQSGEETPERATKDERRTTEIGLRELDGVGPKIEKALVAAGYDTVEKIKGLTAEELVKVDGVGKKTAEKILKSAKGV